MGSAQLRPRERPEAILDQGLHRDLKKLCLQQPTGLVLVKNRCIYAEVTGSETVFSAAPRGGIVATTLQPCPCVAQGSWWTDKNQRLQSHVEHR